MLDQEKPPMPGAPFFTHAQDSEGGYFSGTADRTSMPASVGCAQDATPRAPY